LLEDLTFISNLLKTLTIEPVLPISFVVAILAFILTVILTFALTFTIPVVLASASAELTLLSIPKITAALSPATYIPTKPQVQP
jgi:hypothetical protein